MLWLLCWLLAVNTKGEDIIATPTGPGGCDFPSHWDPDGVPEGIEPFNEILPGLYLGNYHATDDLEALRAREITLIINAGQGVPNHYPADFAYFNAWMPREVVTSQFKRTMTLINIDIAAFRKRGGSVLILCRTGISRSPTLMLAHLITARGMTLDEALTLVKEKRPGVDPNDAFMAMLRRLADELWPWVDVLGHLGS